MPVILNPQGYELWLDPAIKKPRLLDLLLRSDPAQRMTAYPINTLNNPEKRRSLFACCRVER